MCFQCMVTHVDNPHSDTWKLYRFYGLVVVIVDGPILDFLGHPMIGNLDVYRRDPSYVLLEVTGRENVRHRHLHETLTWILENVS